MESIIILKILFLPLGILISAFFAGTEIALTSLSSMNLAQLKTNVPFRKPLFEFWENSSDKVLASIILGNTLGTVFCGVLAASIGHDCAALWGFSSQWLVPLFSLTVTILALIFGEILPKILGRAHAESLASWGIASLTLFTKAMHPLIQVLTRIAALFVKILGAEPRKEIPILTASDIKGMLGTEGMEEAQSSSHRILKNILEFGQLRVKDVQKPIEKMTTVNISKTPKEIIATVTTCPYSRIPAYQDSLDNIVGIIYAKDLLAAWRTEGLILIQDLLRPVFYVSTETLVSDLLREFKKGHHHLALVHNGSKKVTGMVTIEDLLEEIIGELYGEQKMQ